MPTKYCGCECDDCDDVEALEDEIAIGRSRLDYLDEKIARLLAERIAESGNVQDAKKALGENTVNLTREREVINVYEWKIGPGGRRIADAILTVSKYGS